MTKKKQIIDCPQCEGKLRVPVTECLLKMNCPHCGHVFAHRSSEEIQGGASSEESRGAAAASTSSDAAPVGVPTSPTRRPLLPTWFIGALLFATTLAILLSVTYGYGPGKFIVSGIEEVWRVWITIFAWVGGGWLVWRIYTKIRSRRAALGISDPIGAGPAALFGFGLGAALAQTVFALLQPSTDRGDLSLLTLISATAASSLTFALASGFWVLRITSRFPPPTFLTVFLWVLFSQIVYLPAIFVREVLVPKVSSEDLATIGLVLASTLSALSATYLVWRFVIGRWIFRKRDSSADDETVSNLVAGTMIFVIGFAICLFVFSSNDLLGWPQVPAMAISVLIPGLLLMLGLALADDAPWLSLGSLPVIAAASLLIAVVAVQFPPSGIGFLFIVLASVSAAMTIMLYPIFVRLLSPRQGISSSFVLNVLVIMSAAFLMLTMPGTPTPAQRLAAAEPMVVAPLGERVMQLYAASYENPQARAVINVVEGLRYAAVSVRAAGAPQSLDVNRARLQFEIRNIGEKGVARIALNLPDIQKGKGEDEGSKCVKDEWDLVLAPPLWPGEERMVQVVWTRPKGCESKAWREALRRILTDEKHAPLSVTAKVSLIAEVDRQGLFKREARLWLGL